jgi:hypothetical protein
MVTEHSTESGHRIESPETKVLAKTSGYMDELVRETVDVKLHPDNINREEGFKHIKAWNPTTRILGHSKIHTS